MVSIFRYFEVGQDVKKHETPTDLFFVQSELFTKHIELANEAVHDCCQLTITDLTDYWQLTVNRELLMKSFPDSHALRGDARDRVLTEALSGAHYEGTAFYKLFAAKEENRIKIIMRTYLGDFALNAGSFYVDPVDQSKYSEIKKAWHINTAKSSQTGLECEVAQAEELEAAKHQIDELKELVERMNREAFEYKLSMFSNFTKILDTKKSKIKELEYANEDLQRRKRSYDEVKKEEEEDPEQITQSLTQSYNKSRKKSSQCSATTQRTLSSSSSRTTKRSTASTKTASTSSQRTSYASQRESVVTGTLDCRHQLTNTQSNSSQHHPQDSTVKLESSFSIAEQTQAYPSIDLTSDDDDNGQDPSSSLPPVPEASEKSGFLSEDYDTDEDLYEPEPTI